MDLGEKTRVWRELEPWPGAGRMLAVAAVADGAFYLISGTSLSSDTAGKPVRRYLTDVYRYRPRAGWQRMTDIPRAAVAAPSPAPVVTSTQVLVLSGDDGTKVDFQPPEQHPGFPQDVLAYDTKTDTWKVVGKVPVTQVTVPTALWDGRYVIPNGEIRAGVRTPEVWSFSSSQAPAGHKSAGP